MSRKPHKLDPSPASSEPCCQPNMNVGNERQTARRNFLVAGSLGSAAIASGLVVPRGVHAESNAAPSKVRIGLIGCGGRGTGAINDSFSINDNVQMVAMADLYTDNCANARAQMERRHGDKVAVPDDKMHAGLDAYRKVLEDPDVDLVFLTTPPGFRPHYLTEAVAAGKHIFAEKPVCVDPAGYHVCLAADEAARRNGTAIVTGTQYRRQVNYVEAINRIHDGLIGDVVSAVTRYCTNGIWYRGRRPEMSDAEYQLNNWMHFIWLSGDQITEQAVHNIDLINWLMDAPPESAYGSGGRFTRPADSEMWDNMAIDYDYGGGRYVSFMCRQIPGTQSENGTTIYGTNGTAVIRAGSGGSEAFDKDGKSIWSKEGSISDAYKQEHKDLVDSIVSGQPIVELRQTADSSLLAVMGRLAAYSGQRVTWKQVSEEMKLDLFPKNLTWDSKLPQPQYAIPGETRIV